MFDAPVNITILFKTVMLHTVCVVETSCIMKRYNFILYPYVMDV
jgi:hypothetical protein